VLYTSHYAENEPTTAASRRAARRLREARSPSTAYGSRVHRRLRGRWFSLVPVRRRALVGWCAAIASIVALLCLGHYASVSWTSIAYRPEIARALRLDRPDSFGRWFTCVLLAGASGISFLIYQLRRHKNDDFRGHYRLWRLVLIVLMLASVDALVSLVDWSGALLDAGFGKRVALSGNDWVGIVLSVGGAVLALRLTVEVRRSRWALATIMMAWVILALPMAARWNFFGVDTMSRWLLVTAAPLVGSAMIFVSLVGYLRLLYREVRKIEDSRSLTQRLGDLRLSVFAPRDDGDEHDRESDDESDEPTTVTQRRGWFGRRRNADEQRKQAGKDDTHDDPPQNRREKAQERKEAQERKLAQERREQNEQTSEDSDEEPRRKRGWFGLRRKADDETSAPEDNSNDESDEAPEKAKRRRFSMRLRPSAKSEAAAGASEADHGSNDNESTDAEETPKSKPKKRFGIGGWMNREKPKSDAGESDDDEPSGGQTHQDSHPSSQVDDDDEEIDVDDIDWSSMSKAERRRLRKKLKRQGRAA
tara:strand:+ start:55581 stop:57182 length:1602 start_codon:yes stop_codon:yes gene_type:complete